MCTLCGCVVSDLTYSHVQIGWTHPYLKMAFVYGNCTKYLYIKTVQNCEAEDTTWIYNSIINKEENTVLLYTNLKYIYHSFGSQLIFSEWN